MVSPRTPSPTPTKNQSINAVKNLFKRSSTTDEERTNAANTSTLTHHTHNNSTNNIPTNTHSTSSLPTRHSMYDLTHMFENRTNSPTRSSPFNGINSAFAANSANTADSPNLHNRKHSPVSFHGHEDNDSLSGVGLSLGRGNHSCVLFSLLHLCLNCLCVDVNDASHALHIIYTFFTLISSHMIINTQPAPLQDSAGLPSPLTRRPAPTSPSLSFTPMPTPLMYLSSTTIC